MPLLGGELADIRLVATIVNFLGVNDVKYQFGIDAATGTAYADVLIRIVGDSFEIGDRFDGVTVVDGIASRVEQPKSIKQFVNLRRGLMDIHDHQFPFVCLLFQQHHDLL